MQSLETICLACHGFVQFFYFVSDDMVLLVVVSVSTFSSLFKS